jgi:hypothetical protein
LNQLLFGGSPDLDTRTETLSWETLSELQFFLKNHITHKVKVTADARLDRYQADIGTNRLGTFAFRSLDDLAAGRPASFTRLVDATAVGGNQVSSYLAVGDLWRVSPTFQLLYGARLEGNAFPSVPAFNPLIAREFGHRTDFAPATVHASPRLGFTWVKKGISNNGALVSRQVGQFHSGPTAFIRGGIGEFRNALPADLLAGAMANTALPGGNRHLACYGPAAPAPTWSTYLHDPSSIPTTCSSFSASGAFADSVSGVELFDRRFEPPRSWRANLSYTSQLGPLSYAIEGTYSLNQSQSGFTNLNFRNASFFDLANERRPVFVPLSGIVAATGTLSPVGSRADTRFGEVISRNSDSRSISRQLVLSLWPDLFARRNWYARFDYTLTGARSLQSGFDGSTFQSPLLREWTRAPTDIRHQFLLRAGYGSSAMAFTVFARAQSGIPFTPIVGSDVNGDGRVNDRAFIFDAANLIRSNDSSLSAGMSSLLAASPRVRRCLLSQFGRSADANSCVGPWTSSMNAQVTLFGGNLRVPRRISTIAVSLINPLGGLDQVLHGKNRLHGWGTPAQTDPVLYAVRGFDASARVFKYEVNPRFGGASPGGTLGVPFRISIDVAFNFSRDIPLQQLERSLKPGRRGYPGPRLTIPELKLRYAINLPNAYAAIIADPDSLLLSPDQVEALRQAQVKWLEQRDTLLASLAGYLADLGETYDVTDALNYQEATLARGWELARVDAQQVLSRILSPAQLRIVPGVASTLMRLRPGERPGGRTIL